MDKLKLESIKKTYNASGTTVEALKGINLSFAQSGFVSILGPSGCGKTTTLNIIGGLDKYTSGDLIINGISTKNYKDKDWDAYRNSQIGFVFQSYNLISHQTVLQNVEVSLTLTGVSSKERHKRAKEALKSVGLSDQINKRPNQLSGGQMQRVAIARALVNNPNIILADEPTGALDSKTSVQIMELLKEISKDKLVIMVTHNADLASEYSNRIINLLDGQVLSDVEINPVSATNTPDVINNKKMKKTSMSYLTALSLSFRNLLTKKNRTLITAIAGSIGIIGVALVLSLSSGLTTYINEMQSEQLAGFPITVTTGEQWVDVNTGPNGEYYSDNNDYTKYTDANKVYSYDSSANLEVHNNIFTDEYLDYINSMNTELSANINTISYTRAVNINLLTKINDVVTPFDLGASNLYDPSGMFGGGSSYFNEMPNNDEFILSLYDLIGTDSRLPKEKTEIAIVVDEYNRIDSTFFEKFGINAEEVKFEDLLNTTLLKVIPNDDYYNERNGIFTSINKNEYANVYESSNGVKLVVTAIMRLKEDSTTSFLPEGIVYTTALTDYVVENAESSKIALAQKDSDTDVLTGLSFIKDEYKDARLLSLGSSTMPVSINVYPKDFNSKDEIKKYLDSYNEKKSEENQILYTDLAETLSDALGTMIKTVSYVLIGFASISLVVSTIMISIITYVSVIERTKEIGILRSVGARKKDISRIFNAEAVILGFTAGTLGVIVSYLLTIPINKAINSLVGIDNIASLSIKNSIMLILGSMFLTLIAGFIPAKKAAKKDPVIALRTE